MQWFICFVLILSIIHFGLSLDPAFEEAVYLDKEEDDVDDSSSSSTTITSQSIVENIIDNITESITIPTILNEKQFLTEHLLNVNLSSTNITLKTYFNNLILININNQEVLLINKTSGIIENHFKYANIIPIKQSDVLVIYDENLQRLSIRNSTHQQNSFINFKPKQIYIFSSSWTCETLDDTALYISQDFGMNWKKIDDSSSSIVLGWSKKSNSVIINQYSRSIKLLNLITYEMKLILNDISSTKLFTNYFVSKRTNDSILITPVNNLIDKVFQSLPKRFQSQGNFYCAIEDINTQDLLLLFMTYNKLGDNNETILSTCNLISYSKQNLFYLSNVHCGLNFNTIECSKEQLPLYQVHGLSTSVYLANVGSKPMTMISFDGGINWNKTSYECDKMMNCPNNISIIISSLISSNEAPGIVLGKASDGVNEYVAISSNGGRLWRLSSKGNNYLSTISNPSALIVTILNNHQLSSDHSFRYSTDYGHNWHEERFSNKASFQILSFMADNNNIFYVLTMNNENILNLIQLDFNHLIKEQCARHHIKEWSLHSICINGSKFHYRRRISGSHCLSDVSTIRSEPCACSLIDFQCASGYKRSKDGICYPRSHFVYSQDCLCNANNTLLTKRRGYIKSESNQCQNGIENYLSDAYVIRRDLNHPNFFLYGIDSNTKRTTIEIHTIDFDQNDDEDDDENLKQNTIWSVDETYDITALAFNENGKEVYMAVDHNQLGIIYRIGKNLRQQNQYTEKVLFDSNNELYRSTDERIEYLTIDWLTKNLYVLIRNRKSLQQTIFLLDIRTHKRRTLIRNQQIHPSILIVDPIKTELYWISHNSPSVFNIANLQGQIKKQIELFSKNSFINYMSYNPLTHEIIFIMNSIIYGLNTLDHNSLSPRIIYEHSSNIQNALFVHPILYFTHENNETDSTVVYLHSINILAKSFAKNIAKFKDFNSIKLFIDMAPIMPTNAATIINRCVNDPCSDICIPLEHGKFRCLCSDDAPYQSCSCPIEERFTAGACQAKNNQCSPSRILCQNGINCAESARMCEQDHTQYTESFKNTARCTIDKPNDGFDCYYKGHGINNTCIPFEWLCDGVYDCPFGNDEEHCYKMTTTQKPSQQLKNRCLTDKKFTHVVCHNQCISINDVCQNVSNVLLCPEQFHLHCKQTHDKNQYVCKCHDDKNRCIAMIEQCDDFERCEQICRDSLHYANSKTSIFHQSSSTTWTILVIAILAILLIVIIIITIRYFHRRKKTPVSTRTPAAPAEVTDSPPSDTREKLLKNSSNTATQTN